MNFIREENRIYCKDENDNIVAEITFEKKSENVFNIDHTFVDEHLRGMGLASKLVQEAVTFIEEKGAKVQATCNYAKKWIEKNVK